MGMHANRRLRAIMKAMKPQKVIEATDLYRAILSARGIMPLRVGGSDISRMMDCSSDDRDTLLSHVMWICTHIPHMITKPAGQAFCLRWAGVCEGIMVAYGLLSVDEVRQQFRESLFVRALEDELDTLPTGR